MEVKWVRDGVLVGEGWMAYLSGIVSKLARDGWLSWSVMVSKLASDGWLSWSGMVSKLARDGCLKGWFLIWRVMGGQVEIGG